MPHTDWDVVIKKARSCHTKEAWARFRAEYGVALSTAQDARTLTEIFKCLKNDPHSLQYDFELWAALIQGCLAGWNLELGREIATFTQRISSAKVAIASAQVFMESGFPAQARDIANRALRLKHNEARENLQLQMILANSYVEQGKHTLALRLLDKMEEMLRESLLSSHDLAEILTNMGRAQFFMGQYIEAARTFDKAHQLWLDLKQWDQAARLLFNAAACLHNTGLSDNTRQAFALIEQCVEIATKHDLKGTLSHCNAFTATDQYQRGHFEDAALGYKKALDLLPATETSYRRLHIISMLAFTYLRLGKFQQAARVGKKTIELAQLDQSERFRIRYLNLHAELNWEEGLAQESQELLQTATKSLFTHGVNTLEELSTLNRYYFQCAELNEMYVMTKVKIADTLRNMTKSWLEHIYSLTQVYLTKKQFGECQRLAKECLARSIESEVHYFRSQSLLTLVMSKMAQNQLDDEFKTWKAEFEASLSGKDTPLAGMTLLIEAGVAYRQGRMKDVLQKLQEARRFKRFHFPYPLIVQSWLDTLSGHSPKLVSPEHVQMVARATSIFFAPSLTVLDEMTFKIGDHYLVNLERYPILAEMLHYLVSVPGHTASPAELQKAVWRQSLGTQGWQQKIRNTIMRLREVCPWTLAPLILQSDNQVRLFHEAIDVRPAFQKPSTTEDQILKLLSDGPMSSLQLSNEVSISQATTKRILKKLAESRKVRVARFGRKVVYEAEIPQLVTMQEETWQS